MKVIKNIIINLIILPNRIFFSLHKIYENIINLIKPEIAYLAKEKFISEIDNKILDINHSSLNKDTHFKLFVPNSLCYYRGKSFSTKEPEMLEWIETYGGRGAFYDIGSNIGIYSIYFAKIKKGNVYSFEPSVFNLRQLCKNISLNKLSEKILVFPLPLSKETGFSKFILSGSDEGGALNAFGVDYGFDGEKINKSFEYSTFGYSLDDLLKSGIISEPPELIKIDVA